MRALVVLMPVLLTLAACRGIPASDASANALLDEAISAAGGKDALQSAQVLHWTGTATVFGDPPLELGIDTWVEPFATARSHTWIRAQGAASARDLELDATGGWMVRSGTRTPLPAAMVRHERLQYAVYGLMRLVTLRDRGVRLERAPDIDGLRVLRVEHPDAAPAELVFDPHGKLVALTDTVPAAEGAGTLAQRFEFEGDIASATGVHWPRRIRILQDGKPYFELRLQTFATGVRLGRGQDAVH